MIPVKTHNVRYCLQAWELLFVDALLLSYKYTEISVDRFVCGL